jgi:hypothetical protein
MIDKLFECIRYIRGRHHARHQGDIMPDTMPAVHGTTAPFSEYDALREALRRHGWDVATYSPGDGVTRYRLVKRGQDYFEGSGPTALGRAQAIVMVRAVLYILGSW